MPRSRRKAQEPPTIGASGNTPAQEDESDILDESDAEVGENGELIVTEEKARELGAVDAASVRDNRRNESIVNKKRGNVQGVNFNVDDVLVKYEMILRIWPPNTLSITVRRLTGSPVQNVITSQPRSGAELYEALKVAHGQNQEAEYEVCFIDANRKNYVGKGRITMPDTRGPQQGQPMNPYFSHPPGYPPSPAPAPGYAPPASPYPTVPVSTAPSSPAFQSPQQASPVVVQQPDMNAMLGTMQQMFEMVQRMQAQQQPAPTPHPQPQFVAPQPSSPLPPPPATPDMGSMLVWMQQMFEMVQRMQPPAPHPGGGSAPQPATQTANPMLAMMGMPPVTPPPGHIFVPGWGFVPVDALMRAMSGGASMGPPRPQYRPQYPQHGGEHAPPGYFPPSREREPPPSPPPRSPVDQLREAATVIRSALDTVNEINTVLPGMTQSAPAPEPIEVASSEEDSPVRIIDTGQGKILVNKNDGGLRAVETLWANADKLLGWAGKQMDEFRKMQQQHPAPVQQLPPGYVEVGPGYVPPPGFVAIPVDPRQGAGLPQPPAHMPPPIRPAAPQTQQGWAAPVMPERE
jgi:hypothetical protein